MGIDEVMKVFRGISSDLKKHFIVKPSVPTRPSFVIRITIDTTHCSYRAAAHGVAGL